MTIQQIHNQIQEISQQIQLWIKQGYTPTIQKQKLLEKLENIYQTLNENNIAIPQKTTKQGTCENIPDKQNQKIEEHDQIAQEGVKLMGSIITEQLYKQFIEELFWRDQSFFDNEIRKFKNMDNIDNALIYIGERYNWAPNNTPAERFIELLDTYYNS